MLRWAGRSNELLKMHIFQLRTKTARIALGVVIALDVAFAAFGAMSRWVKCPIRRGPICRFVVVNVSNRRVGRLRMVACIHNAPHMGSPRLDRAHPSWWPLGVQDGHLVPPGLVPLGSDHGVPTPPYGCRLARRGRTLASSLLDRAQHRQTDRSDHDRSRTSGAPIRPASTNHLDYGKV